MAVITKIYKNGTYNSESTLWFSNAKMSTCQNITHAYILSKPRGWDTKWSQILKYDVMYNLHIGDSGGGTRWHDTWMLHIFYEPPWRLTQTLKSNMANIMLKLKIDPNLVGFGFCCKSLYSFYQFYLPFLWFLVMVEIQDDWHNVKVEDLGFSFSCKSICCEPWQAKVKVGHEYGSWTWFLQVIPVYDSQIWVCQFLYSLIFELRNQ